MTRHKEGVTVAKAVIHRCEGTAQRLRSRQRHTLPDWEVAIARLNSICSADIAMTKRENWPQPRRASHGAAIGNLPVGACVGQLWTAAGLQWEALAARVLLPCPWSHWCICWLPNKKEPSCSLHKKSVVPQTQPQTARLPGKKRFARSLLLSWVGVSVRAFGHNACTLR